MDRERLVSELQARPDLHLVVVRYSANHDVNNDWVYNAADVDGSKIVWAARDMGADMNKELLDYFSRRQGRTRREPSESLSLFENRR